MTIGPKPLEEFSDRECALIEEAAAEGNAYLTVLGDAIGAVLPGIRSEHLMILNPED